MKNLIVATDGSDSAMRAVVFAAQLATTFGAELHLVTVAPHGGLVDDEPQAYARTEGITLNEALDAQSERILGEATTQAQQSGAAQFRTEMAIGDPAQEILAIADREKADGIIVGKRGRGTLRAMLLGSVSHKLVALAQCPVIVVP